MLLAFRQNSKNSQKYGNIFYSVVFLLDIFLLFKRQCNHRLNMWGLRKQINRLQAGDFVHIGKKGVIPRQG